MLYWINSEFWVNWRKLEIGPLLPYFYTFRDPKLTAKNDFTFRAFPFTRNTFNPCVSLLKNPQYCVLFSPPTLQICLPPKGQFYNTTYFSPTPQKFFLSLISVRLFYACNVLRGNLVFLEKFYFQFHLHIRLSDMSVSDQW